MKNSAISKARVNLEKFLESLEEKKEEENNERNPIFVHLGFPAKRHHYYYVYAGSKSDAHRVFGQLQDQGKIDRLGFLPYVVMRHYFNQQEDVKYEKLTPMKSKKLRKFVKFLKTGQKTYRRYIGGQI